MTLRRGIAPAGSRRKVHALKVVCCGLRPGCADSQQGCGMADEAEGETGGPSTAVALILAAAAVGAASP